MSNTTALPEQGELSREVIYLRKLAEQSVARMLTVETQAFAIRHELEQKRRGFSLMADLAVNLKHGADYNVVFTSVAQRLGATLNMQRTVVLRLEPDGCFRPAIIQGYPVGEMKNISALRLSLDEELLSQTLLVTGADPDERLAGFRLALDLPFLISTPVRLNGRTAAVLVTGRQAEQPPFLPRLGQSDLETVQTLGAYLAFMLTGQRLEEEEAEKRDLEEVMRTVFTATVDGYIIWDGARVTKAGPGALKLLGLPPDSTLEEHDSLGLSTHHLNAVFQKVLESGRTREEILLKNSAGEPIPCEISYLPLRLHAGTRLLSYIRDLRAQKAHEKALLAAKEAAEAAAVAKGEFLANISHEIRTPINAIVGLSHLLKDSPAADGKQSEYIGGIEEAATALMGLVSDVLDFSRIDAGKLRLESAPFNMEEALDELIAQNRPRAEGKGLAFSLEKRLEGQTRVLGDWPRLKQILDNLIDNALKFTVKGAVGVSVKALPNAGSRLGFKFTVKDTGIGMGPEAKARVFDAFAQADGSSTRKYGGVGLGLTIARRLVEMFGGQISCESSPGQGSAFRFTAFFDAAPAAKGENQMTEMRGKILLVEDNAVNQLVARKIMEKAGLSVEVADNGKIALDMIEAEPFDLVFMDIQMPEMDGLTATRHIRANPKFDKLPIVAMTAHAQEDDKDLSLKIGMNGHITKPINLKELFAVLGEWLPEEE